MAVRMKESEMAGPAPGRPRVDNALEPCSSRSSTGACRIDWYDSVSPAAAVPVRMKMPEPITAPMPSAVRLHGPSVLRSRRAGSSEAAMSASMLFVRSSWDIGIVQ